MTRRNAMAPAGVGVVIVNWNSHELLGRCLAALAVQQEQITRTIVVDNGSDNPPGELPRRRPTNTSYIRLPRNVGFARANNMALAELRDCEWIALVNPDAFPEPDWLARIVEATRRYPGYASFACRMLKAENPAVLDGAGDTYHVSGLARRKCHGVAEARCPPQDREVFSACAAAALYRREVLEAVGGFDEDFFCYMEDTDLGFRMRLSGHRCMLVSDAVVRHVGSATTGGQKSDFSVYHGHRNLVWAFVKDMPGALFWALLPLHIAMNVVTVAVYTMRGQGTVIIRAKRDAIRGLPKMWRKRRQIQSSRKASLRDIWTAIDKAFY